jgi:hypothetical protein
VLNYVLNKKCRICNKYLSLDNFYKTSDTKDKLTNSCKDCERLRKQEWRKKNKETVKNQITTYRKKFPWIYTFDKIDQRCNNPKNDAYSYYGGKGIKCLITINEIKTLWFRDKAFEMKRPTIDRQDSNGNYEFNNCRFIEKTENSKRAFKEYWDKKKNG